VEKTASGSSPRRKEGDFEKNEKAPLRQPGGRGRAELLTNVVEKKKGPPRHRSHNKQEKGGRGGKK